MRLRQSSLTRKREEALKQPNDTSKEVPNINHVPRRKVVPKVVVLNQPLVPIREEYEVVEQFKVPQQPSVFLEKPLHVISDP